MAGFMAYFTRHLLKTSRTLWSFGAELLPLRPHTDIQISGQIGFDSGLEWYVSTQCAWRWALKYRPSTI